MTDPETVDDIDFSYRYVTKPPLLKCLFHICI